MLQAFVGAVFATEVPMNPSTEPEVPALNVAVTGADTDTYAGNPAQTGQVAIKNATGTVVLIAHDPQNGATQGIVLRIV